MNQAQKFILVFIFFTTGYLFGAAQVVTSGAWTGYVDGISNIGFLMRDSILYTTSWNGTAKVDPATNEYKYFRDFGNPALPEWVNLKHSTIDPDGLLWTILDDLLVNISSDGTIRVAGPSPKYQTSFIKSDQTGKIWAALYTSSSVAIAKFNGSSWEYMNADDNYFDIDDMAFDSQNNPWFIGNGRLFKFNGISFDIVTDGSTPVVGVKKLAISKNGKIATCGGIYQSFPLRYFDGNNWMTFQEAYSHPVFDEDNVLWLIGSNKHIYRMDDNDIAPHMALTSPQNYRTISISSENVEGLGFDQFQRLWLGKSSGLFMAPDKFVDQWQFVPLSSLLVPNKPNLMAASDDTAWLLTGSHFTRMYDHTFEKVDLPQQGVNSMFYDENRDGIWMCSPGIAGFLEGATLTQINLNPLFADSSNSNIVTKIRADTMGAIWFKAKYDVLRYDLSGEWFVFSIGDELPSSPGGISDMYINRNDNSVWISIYGFSHPSVSPRLVKITNNQVEEIAYSGEFPGGAGFAVISDSVFWYTSGEWIVLYENGDTTRFKPGYINNQEFLVYDESTVLLCSNFGLYIFHNNEWYYPEFPHGIGNRLARPATLTSNGKLYLGYYSLLVVEDISELLKTLTPVSPDAAKLPELSLFPNPVGRYLFILSKDSECVDCSVDIIAINGTLVRSIPAPLPQVIDLKHLTPGMYLLRVHAPGKKSRALKFVRH